MFDKDRIRNIRKSKRMSIRYLSFISGLSTSAISSWENGSRHPTEKNIRALAKALSIHISDISDLPVEHPKSEITLDKMLDSWQAYLSNGVKGFGKIYEELFGNLKTLKLREEKNSIIIRAIVNAMHPIFYFKDTSSKYIIVNQAFMKHVGADENTLIKGRKECDFLPLAEAEINNTEDTEVLLTGKPVIDKESYLPGSRKKRWCIKTKVPVFDFENKIVGIIGTFSDITQRKQSEEYREKLESAINNMDECIYLGEEVDGKENVLFLNDAIETITGIKKEHFFKDEYIYRKLIHPEHLDKVYKHDSNKDQFARTCEFKITRVSDNKERWVKDKSYRIKKTFLGIVKDVTNQKKSEERNELLEQSLNML